MRYMGSKNRLAKEIAPIIQSYIDDNNIDLYVEPFTGGGNMIDKIRCKRRIGYDIEKYVMSTLIALRDGWIPPERVTEEEYKHIKEHKEEYPPELVGYCGYQLSYGGKFFDCYRRDKVGKRDYCREAYNFTFKQVPHLEGIEFYIKDYREIDEPKGAVIYCDPPYRDTGKYTAVGGFNHEEFYEWVVRLAKDNIVLVSEYYMPEDIAVELWHKEVKVCLDSKRASGKKNVERLFKING